jgi:mRNA interferase RelE/StbE
MAELQIRYSKSALKFLSKTQKSYVQIIREAIDGIAKKPPEGDIKPLVGYKDGRFRLRVGKYRVIYRYDFDGIWEVVYIIDIGARGDIYK